MDTVKIENGRVVQVWRNAPNHDTTDPTLLETPAGAVCCGMLYADGAFTNPPQSPPPPNTPGQSVTPRQIRLALNQAGLRSAVEAYISAAPQDMKDTWEFSTVIERNSPLIAAGAAELNLTEAQIDDLFTLAATL